MLPELFDYKAWANRESIAAVEELRARDERQGKLATRILNHTYVVDRIFAAHLSGETHGYAATNTPETPSLTALREGVAASDAWYCRYVRQLDPASLAEMLPIRFTDGDTAELSRVQILMHVINHGSYHRDAVGRLIVDEGATAPADTITRYLRLTAVHATGQS